MATDAAGRFEFDDIPGGHTLLDGQPSDEIDIAYPYVGSGPGLLGIVDWSLDFSADNIGSAYSYDMQPAAVPLTFANPPANGLIEVEAGNSEHGLAAADVQVTGGQATAIACR